MKVTKICTQCKIEYLTYQSNIKNSLNTYCTSKCYGLWQRSKTYTEQNKPVRPIRLCSINECTRKHFGKGYCKHHYSKLIEHANRKPVIRSQKLQINCPNCNILFTSKLVKEKWLQHCSSKCYGEATRKPFIIKKGYKKILNYNHPRADKKGYVFEHILVMENYLKRSIVFPEEIHHIDGNRGNNSIDNLMVFPDHKSHMDFHKNHSKSR